MLNPQGGLFKKLVASCLFSGVDKCCLKLPRMLLQRRARRTPPCPFQPRAYWAPDPEQATRNGKGSTTLKSLTCQSSLLSQRIKIACERGEPEMLPVRIGLFTFVFLASPPTLKST
jgi:hypothetical protein